MIKLPKKIVIYPQKLERPDYLLCWIPPDSYQQVTSEARDEEELSRFYPNGIEVELSEDGLDEFGIQLPVPADELRQVYLELNELGTLPESGMVEVYVLEEYLSEKEAGRSPEEITRPSLPGEASFSISEGDLVQKMGAEPEMRGEEDPQDLFQRLSVRKIKPPIDRSGGE